MLKPYEEKLKLIKSEVEKLGLDIVEALEVCLKALNERKIENLKNVEVSEKKFLVKSPNNSIRFKIESPKWL